MDRPTVEVLTDDQISTPVLDILRNAKKHAALVSPYNKFWAHLRNEFQRTVDRGVQVDFIFRSDQRNEDIEWLESVGVKTHAVENLHAKIYLNESSVLVTSMNLHESSSKNSMEICISINDQQIRKDVRGYVRSLLGNAQTAKEGKTNSSRAASSRVRTRKQQTVSESRKKTQASDAKPSLGGLLKGLVAAVTDEGGRCIRCNDSVDFDPDRPLCEDCFKTWNQYGDWDYPEKYCHSCGEKRKTSYAKPLCRPCYDQAED